MRRLFVVVAAITMVIALCAPASAYDEAYHVKLSTSGVGDMIIFPGFYTDNIGTETKFTVINTDDEYSVICKVIVRSQRWTTELLDFLIYLSPSDVWTGSLRQVNGRVVLWSDDDSILRAAGQFASPENPVQQEMLGRAALCNGDTETMGYVEVIETWYGKVDNYTAAQANDNPDWAGYDKTAPHVDKLAILALYPPDAAYTPAVPGYDNSIGNGNSSIGLDHTINAITGYMEIQNGMISGDDLIDWSGAMQGVVFADMDISQNMNVLEISGLNSFLAKNNINELEAVLAKNDIAMPYYNKPLLGQASVHFFNFPTKQSNPDTADKPDCTYNNTTQVGEFWERLDYNGNGVPDQCVRFHASIYDRFEAFTEDPELWSGGVDEDPTGQMCWELSFFASNDPELYDEGWIRYDFEMDEDWPQIPFSPERVPGPPAEFTYEGVPVIPWIVHLKGDGLSLAEGAARDDGTVWADSTVVAGKDESYENAAQNAAWIPDYDSWNGLKRLGQHLRFNDAGNPINYPISGHWTNDVPDLPPTFPNFP